jgi:nucleoside-diphosphate-sugar epimerase
MSSEQSGPFLIIGCGYLGQRVATAWPGGPVAALTRGRAAELTSLGIQPHIGDVLDSVSLQSLPAVSMLLYAVGLDRSAGRSMREVYVDGLANVLKNVHCAGPFVYISSTGVYGQTNGEWVDENSLTEPIEESGRVVLAAEQTLRQLRPDAIILRFAGIYGPNRVLRRQALLNGEPLTNDADKWLNLIHVADGVQAVLAAFRQGKPGETYLIADDEPVTRRDFYTRSAELLDAPPAQFATTGATGREPNRSIRNSHAKKLLGWQPEYRSYREGLAACGSG